MAAQALVSSSLTSSVQTARQIFGSKPVASASQKKSSFVVKATSSPPVKVLEMLYSFISISLYALILILCVLVY